MLIPLPLLCDRPPIGGSVMLKVPPLGGGGIPNELLFVDLIGGGAMLKDEYGLFWLCVVDEKLVGLFNPKLVG